MEHPALNGKEIKENKGETQSRGRIREKMWEGKMFQSFIL